jgi:hypothetical protein
MGEGRGGVRSLPQGRESQVAMEAQRRMANEVSLRMMMMSGEQKVG